MAENEKPQGDEAPKIIIDSDWKAQAQAEKERLAKEVEGAKATAGPGLAAGGEAGAEGGEQELPPANFITLVNSVAAQALMSLGGYVDPRTNRRLVDLDLAKHLIDTLAVLEEKTRGNLTEEEKGALDQALYEVRMHYVQLAQRVGGA